MPNIKTIVSLPPGMLKDWRAARIADMDISNTLHDQKVEHREALKLAPPRKDIDWKAVNKAHIRALKVG